MNATTSTAPPALTTPPAMTFHVTATHSREISRALGDRPIGYQAGVAIGGLFRSKAEFAAAIATLPLNMSRRSILNGIPTRPQGVPELPEEGVMYVALLRRDGIRNWVRLDSVDAPDYARRVAEGWGSYSVVLDCGHEHVRSTRADKPLPSAGDESSCHSSCDGVGRVSRMVKAVYL